MRGRTNVIARPTPIVNGNIRSFKVGSGRTVNTGDFVNLFYNDAQAEINNQLVSKVIPWDDNHLFVVYKSGEVNFAGIVERTNIDFSIPSNSIETTLQEVYYILRVGENSVLIAGKNNNSVVNVSLIRVKEQNGVYSFKCDSFNFNVSGGESAGYCCLSKYDTGTNVYFYLFFVSPKNTNIGRICCFRFKLSDYDNFDSETITKTQNQVTSGEEYYYKYSYASDFIFVSENVLKIIFTAGSDTRQYNKYTVLVTVDFSASTQETKMVLEQISSSLYLSCICKLKENYWYSIENTNSKYCVNIYNIKTLVMQIDIGSGVGYVSGLVYGSNNLIYCGGGRVIKIDWENITFEISNLVSFVLNLENIRDMVNVILHDNVLLVAATNVKNSIRTTKYKLYTYENNVLISGTEECGDYVIPVTESSEFGAIGFAKNGGNSGEQVQVYIPLNRR